VLRREGELSSQRWVTPHVEQVRQWLETAGLRLSRCDVLQVRPRARRSHVVVAGKDGAGLLLRLAGKRLCFAAVDPWSVDCTSGVLYPLVDGVCSLEEVKKFLGDFEEVVRRLREQPGCRGLAGPADSPLVTP